MAWIIEASRGFLRQVPKPKDNGKGESKDDGEGDEGMFDMENKEKEAAVAAS